MYNYFHVEILLTQKKRKKNITKPLKNRCERIT